MSICPDKKTVVASVCVLIGIALFMTLTLSTSAQQRQSNRPPRPDPATTIRDRNREMIQRETIIDGLRKPPAKAVPTREHMRILEQIGEDYVRIQILNNEIMSAAAKGDALNYERLTEQSAEITKRARRLKNNLSLPEPEESNGSLKSASTRGNEELAALLLTLDKHIGAFISNPYFKNPTVLNAQHSAAASADLQSIIEISKRVKIKCKDTK